MFCDLSATAKILGFVVQARAVQLPLFFKKKKRLRPAHHNIDNEDGNVTKRTPTRAQIRERFVAGSVDDQKARNLIFLSSFLQAMGLN